MAYHDFVSRVDKFLDAVLEACEEYEIVPGAPFTLRSSDRSEYLYFDVEIFGKNEAFIRPVIDQASCGEDDD